MRGRILWALALLLAIYLVVYVIPIDASRIQVVAAVATAAAALIALATAEQSAKAAAASERAAKDAIRALSTAGKPSLSPSMRRMNGEWVLELENRSLHPLRQAHVRWSFADGAKGSYFVGHLPASTHGGFLRAQSPEYAQQTSVPELAHRDDGQCDLVITYQGETGPLIWQATYRLSLGTEQRAMHVSEKELSEADSSPF
ncbi:hypothetical protein DEJ01_04845 [Curtobacterium sp. MCLR17_040]|uniref:hypothetical protein n=1 Tax=Curtobacterium sp. MCLR17_040 TaxID=2175625 RepID=UPI000DA95665|nr:hypothetical protein [Curtobacterium sp. MCLR17_040]PZF06679.1 hypothetical protein DEJ01_04845 [Curtobacterium sp. MCLR17_040]